MGKFVGRTTQRCLSLLSVVLLCFVKRVQGFSGGAGSCEGGEAAVGGLHLTRPETIQAEFADRGIQVSIGGNRVVPGQSLGLIASDSLEVEITATTNQFRGALIRLEADDGQSVLGGLTPGTNAAVAMTCQAPVVGITHFDNDLKSVFSGTLMVDALGAATLDITVVEINSAESSIYMYGGYSMTFISSPTSGGVGNAPGAYS